MNTKTKISNIMKQVEKDANLDAKGFDSKYFSGKNFIFSKKDEGKEVSSDTASIIATKALSKVVEFSATHEGKGVETLEAIVGDGTTNSYMSTLAYGGTLKRLGAEITGDIAYLASKGDMSDNIRRFYELVIDGVEREVNQILQR